ncbi:RNA polymerase sigma factor [Pseudoduganella lurida]|nr:sigma-70 family RNA polymerase sigma factor [Pseudoduganella lurida]
MTDHRPGITETVARERKRLFGFIRRRVPDPGDAEDILQDVLHEFVRACSLPEPIEQVGAWLARVAQNRIIDRVRKKREEALPEAMIDAADESFLDHALPSSDDGPEAAYTRAVLLDAIVAALEELPANERDVFIAHELEGLSFNELAERDGIKVNTLLGWKRRAVLHLRARLQPFYDDDD